MLEGKDMQPEKVIKGIIMNCSKCSSHKISKRRKRIKGSLFVGCILGIVSVVFGMDMNVVNETVGMIIIVSLGLAGVYFAV